MKLKIPGVVFEYKSCRLYIDIDRLSGKIVDVTAGKFSVLVVINLLVNIDRYRKNRLASVIPDGKIPRARTCKKNSYARVCVHEIFVRAPRDSCIRILSSLHVRDMSKRRETCPA